MDCDRFVTTTSVIIMREVISLHLVRYIVIVDYIDVVYVGLELLRVWGGWSDR